jgi:3-dehydroquinate synthase (EC 4.2.3.4)
MAETLTVPVNLKSAGDRSYDICIADGCLADLGQKLRQIGLGNKSDRVLVVTNPIVNRHYGQTVYDSLVSADFNPQILALPAGERFKNANSLHKIYDSALQHQMERSSLIIALGGGVIGDMAGFAAATWLRGIDFVQVPTTLLAMVDASIGGKTGINHPKGKNLIGAFHQPRLVWIDPQVLQTLPLRELRAGMAEVIKYGVIWDRELWQLLLCAERLDSFSHLSAALLQQILYRCAMAKAEVVSRDEREGGLRAILNYGHTLGHAIEAVTNYKLFNHGEAVAVGMSGAGAIARELDLWTEAEYQQQQTLIRKAKLPAHLPASIDHQAIMACLSSDKKVAAGKVKFILPKAIANVMITDAVPPATIAKALALITA